MQRINSMETTLKADMLTQPERDIIFDILKDEANGNVVNQRGKVVVWTKSDDTKIKMLTMVKAGKGNVRRNFPNFYDKEGNKVTEKNLKDKKIADLITPQEASTIIAEKNRQEATESLKAKLTGMNKTEIEKEYGVSKKLTKDGMIEAVIEKIYGAGNV